MKYIEWLINKIGGDEKIEISRLNYVIIGNIEEKLKHSLSKVDMYILGGVKKGLNKRAGDNDMESKCYFIFDIDIRENYKKIYGKVLIQEELNNEIIKLKELLNRDNYLKKWGLIVNSGNGVHIYYFGKELIVGIDITPEEYSRGVRKIYDLYSNFLDSISNDYKYFYPDYSCSNIARPTRLPFSLNGKRKHVKTLIPVLTVGFQDIESELVGMIPKLGKKIQENYQKAKFKKCKKSSNYVNIDVNNYKISEVVKRYTGKDAKKNIKCPFGTHEDKNPSFSIHIEKNICKCHACGIGGNPASFIRYMEKISYKEALQKLKDNF